MHAHTITLAGQLLLNAYLLWRGRAALPKLGAWRLVFTIIIIAELLLYLSGFLLTGREMHELFGFILRLCNIWYFFIIIASMLTLGCDILAILDRYTIKRFSALNQPLKRKARVGLFCAITLISALIIVDGNRRVVNPEVVHLTLSTPKKAADGRKALRIAFIADMQISQSVGASHMRHMAKLILQEKPDILLVGGDIFDQYSYWGRQGDIEESFRKLSREIPLGSYYIMGNHEYREDIGEKKQWVADVEGHLLIDTVVVVDNSFYIVGRDDATQDKGHLRMEMEELITPLDKSKPIILLEHQPKQIDKAVAQGVDLALYGHTHGGQVFPLTIAIRARYPIVYGHRKLKNTDIYVTSGIGAAGAAIRVGTRSEIVIIDYHFDSGKK